MNKLLKVTLITAIMATSGMCMSGECQRTTFNTKDDNIDYELGHTASHDSTWITETTSGSNANIKGDVKITDGSRWIHNKGVISLEGKDNIIDNSELINNGVMDVYNEGKLNIKKSIVSVGDGAVIGADGNSNNENGATINVDRSTIRLIDGAGIYAYGKGTININEGSIFDARDSKDLSNWNTTDNGTFNMLPGSIMYLPKEVTSRSGSGSNGYQFIITLPSEGKPVELRYIMNTDITFDGLYPNVTHSGYDYGHQLKLDENNKESNTGIKFTGTTDKVRLTPIYTWSVSTKCNGEDVKILESRDLQCCDDILW